VLYAETLVRLMVVARANVRVVSGHAAGIDLAAEKACERWGIATLIHAPDYERYGSPRALHVRNSEIVEDSQVLVAFTLGTPGTASTIGKAQRADKPVLIVTAKGPQPTWQDIERMASSIGIHTYSA
jgi:hypothetical protein